MDNILIESMQSLSFKPQKSNEYVKQFENNFVESNSEVQGILLEESDLFKEKIIKKVEPFVFAKNSIDLEVTESKRSTPLHSDDEVTPRRGLDEMMTESKLLNLQDLE